MAVCVTSSGFDKLLVDYHRCMTVMTCNPEVPVSVFGISAMRWVWPDCSVDGEEERRASCGCSASWFTRPTGRFSVHIMVSKVRAHATDTGGAALCKLMGQKM